VKSCVGKWTSSFTKDLLASLSSRFARILDKESAETLVSPEVGISIFAFGTAESSEGLIFSG